MDTVPRLAAHKTPDQSEPYVLLNIPFQIQQNFLNVIFNLVRIHAY